MSSFGIEVSNFTHLDLFELGHGRNLGCYFFCITKLKQCHIVDHMFGIRANRRSCIRLAFFAYTVLRITPGVFWSCLASVCRKAFPWGL